MKLEALAFLLPLALYISPLFYSYDQNTLAPGEHLSMVSRVECETALADPSLVISVDERIDKTAADTTAVDPSFCETLGGAYAQK
jgi:hypothetical protein